MVRVLTLANAPPEYIEAARKLSCQECERFAKPKITTKVSPPHNFIPNYHVACDILFLNDRNNETYCALNIVDYGTRYQQVEVIKALPSTGSPTSWECTEAFMAAWTRFFGYPRNVRVDPGTHFAGDFEKMLRVNGVDRIVATAGEHHQQGIIERAGGTHEQGSASKQRDWTSGHEGRSHTVLRSNQ